jgi:hypothetical protein
MGGTDDPKNLIRVNVAMHAFLHQQLFEQHGKIEDKAAWLSLAGRITTEEARIMVVSQPKSEDHKKKIGDAQQGDKNHRWGKPHTQATKNKISISGKGKNLNKKHTDQSKLLMSENRKGLASGKQNFMYGKTHTDEAKKIISERAKETVSCSRCGYTANKGNFGRWHKECREI